MQPPFVSTCAKLLRTHTHTKRQDHEQGEARQDHKQGDARHDDEQGDARQDNTQGDARQDDRQGDGRHDDEQGDVRQGDKQDAYIQIAWPAAAYIQHLTNSLYLCIPLYPSVSPWIPLDPPAY